ncbi:MAG: cytochrome c biogenesis protein CcsA [Phycisphaerales bacterium]
MLLSFPALAQTAPAGNAHPESALVTEQAAALPNPFGDPVFDPTVAPLSLADKGDFAAALDLAPLRSLAVFHNGRVKILDTLARETVRQITGRTTYQDVIDAPGGETTKVSFEPLFTLLDLVIDPTFYVDRPLLHVEYLPLRRAFLDSALPGDEAAQQRYLMMTRITPRMAAEHYLEMVDRFGTQAPSRRGLDELDRAMALWQESAANMLLVAPESRDDSWHHLSEPLPPGMDAAGAKAWRDASAAAADLGRAWRASDATAANDAITRLAAALPTINAGLYPDSRRSLELAYNRAGAFEWGWVLYFLSLIALVLAFGTGRRAVAGVGVALLIAAIGMHGFGFVARCVLAERFAIQNQFESMTGVSLFAAIVGLALTGLFRKYLYGAAAAATGFLVLIAATQTAIPGQFIEREAAILNTSVLLKYHVTTVLTSYGLITLGMVTSLFYLGAHYFGRGASSVAALAGGAVAPPTEPDESGAAGAGDTSAGIRHRLLKDLDKAQMIVLQLAFWGLGVGILLGAWWADHSWGRWWAFDPKETWALITWIIYLIVIHVRFTTGRNRALVTAWLSVVGFVMMLWTYFGVNLLLPGLHAYA